MSNDQLKALQKSSLEEILVQTRSSETVFNEYIDKSVLGIEIFKELNKRYSEKEKGFFMQDGSKDIGILSRCHCLQTLMSLAQDFGLDFRVDNYFPGQKGDIRKIMDDVIEKIIESVRREENGKTYYVFDASPYDTTHFNQEFSNIDTITWVITTFLLVLKYHANKDVREVCKWEPILIDVIKAGLDYLNDAFIQGDENATGLDTGWNFTKQCVEPSLYFSFAVCECYLDVYSTFEGFLSYLHMLRNQQEYGVPTVSKKQEDFAKAKKNFEEHAQTYEEDRHREVGEREARYDEYNEMARIFRLINDIDDYQPLSIDEDTRYGKLEKHCKELARKVWKSVRHNLADNFFYNNLTDTLTESTLRSATTSDALFNTVYIINIMVGAGLDEILDLEWQQAVRQGKQTEARKKVQEYNDLLESCLLAVQKAFRTYEKLRNDGKDYIVDQFLVGFNEKFDGHPVAVNELRKLRMRCFSLLPMLIHTHNVVSEYLIQYPQYNMRKYLEYILDNRLIGKDGALHWIWESDGYFSGSNYYFVLALSGFYSYYLKYEHKYIEIGADNAHREEQIKDAHLRELQEPGGDLFKKEQELELKKRELAKRQKEIEELKALAHPVEDAVRQAVLEELQKNLPAVMKQVLDHAAKVMSPSFVDATEDTKDGVYSGISNALRELMVATMLNKFMRVRAHGITSADAYTEIKTHLDNDISQVSKFYIGSVKNNDGGESALRKLLAPKTAD